MQSFSLPSLTDLIQRADQGQDTGPAAIQRVVNSLESQVTSGPLADLNSSTVDGDGFVAEVQALESSYEQAVDGEFLPSAPNIDKLLKLQGQKVVADVISLNQQDTSGVIADSDLATNAQTAINSLGTQALYSLGTPLMAFATQTRTFETNLNTLAADLDSSATTPLTIDDVGTLVTVEAEAYRADLHAALQITHPNQSTMVDAAVDNLETTVGTIVQDAPADAQTEVTTAITTFDTAMLGTSGLFGSQAQLAWPWRARERSRRTSTRASPPPRSPTSRARPTAAGPRP